MLRIKFLVLYLHKTLTSPPSYYRGALLVCLFIFSVLTLSCFDAGDSHRENFIPVDESQIKGIRLDVRNPYGRIKYRNGYVYVAGASQLLPMTDGTVISEYGGIQRVNVITLETEPVIHKGHRTSDVAVVSDTKGYFIEYHDWGNSSLKAFNPSTGEVYDGNVAGMGDSNDMNLISLGLDPHNKLWIANSRVDGNSAYSSGIYIVDTQNDTIEGDLIDTNLTPQYITFCKDRAVVVTAAPNNSSGAHSIIPVTGDRIPVNNLDAGTSDLAVDSFGDHFYRIQRYMSDSVMKFHIDQPGNVLAHEGDVDPHVIWQFSAYDEKDRTFEKIASSNPHSLVISSETKGFLLRYESRRAWIVNPSAVSESGFKTGELSLYDYADQDGVPEMTSGVVVGTRLFIACQRLYRDSDNVWETKNHPYLAVFDINTGEEIDTR